MLSICRAETGLFLSFPLDEIRDEFTTTVQNWLAKPGRNELEREDSMEGPKIGGVDAPAALTFLLRCARRVEETRKFLGVQLISGTPADYDLGLDGDEETMTLALAASDTVMEEENECPAVAGG